MFSPTTTDPSSVVTSRQTSFGSSIVLYVWREDGGNVITTQGLERMRQVETWIRDRSGFQDVCLLDENGVCYEAAGLTQYVYSPSVDGCPQYRNPNGTATVQAGPSVADLLRPVINTTGPDVYCTCLSLPRALDHRRHHHRHHHHHNHHHYYYYYYYYCCFLSLALVNTTRTSRRVMGSRYWLWLWVREPWRRRS